METQVTLGWAALGYLAAPAKATEDMCFDNNPSLLGYFWKDIEQGEFPVFWGDCKYHPQRPHRLTCLQLTHDMKDLMSVVLDHYHNVHTPEQVL